MSVRPRPALTSLLVNAALYTALLAGLTTPPEARAESPSITLLASDRAAEARTDYAGLYARLGRALATFRGSPRPPGVNEPRLSAYDPRHTAEARNDAR